MRNLNAFSIITLVFSILILGCSDNNQNQLNSANKTLQPSPSESIAPTLTKSQAKVTKSEFGDKWAFTVDEGILECEDQKVLFKSDGKIYAVNGTAKSFKKYLPIDEIWADDPKISGAKQNLGSIIESGLKLCQ